MRFVLALAAVVVLARIGSAGDAPLQELSRFLDVNYCIDRVLVSREISFTAPVSGAETTFLYFEWKVTASDQYGRAKRDELFGVVKYFPSGELEQLVIGGPLVGDKRLRDLRHDIRAARGWPNRARTLPFGPAAQPDEIGRTAAAAVSELLGVAVRVEDARFKVLNSIKEPDGTWHVDLRAVGDQNTRVIKARVEPFTAKVIEVDVCRANDC
jgi:hypothetical protein